MSWGFIRTGEYGSTKSNWKRIVSQEGRWCVSIETDGEGQYLGGKGFETVGNGLYLMKEGGLYYGRELILGPNSPFKNIPILRMLLYYFFQKKISYTLKMEIDGNDGHIYCLKKFMRYRQNLSQREINETNLVPNLTEELILLA